MDLWSSRRGVMVAANDKPLGFYVCTHSSTGGAQWKISVFVKARVFASHYSRNPRLCYLCRNQTRLSAPRECQRICSQERKISGVYASPALLHTAISILRRPAKVFCSHMQMQSLYLIPHINLMIVVQSSFRTVQEKL